MLSAVDLRLTADEAVKMAMSNNLSIKQADVSFKGLKVQKITSFGGLMPSLSGNFSFSSPAVKGF